MRQLALHFSQFLYKSTSHWEDYLIFFLFVNTGETEGLRISSPEVWFHLGLSDNDLCLLCQTIHMDLGSSCLEYSWNFWHWRCWTFHRLELERDSLAPEWVSASLLYPRFWNSPKRISICLSISGTSPIQVDPNNFIHLFSHCFFLFFCWWFFLSTRNFYISQYFNFRTYLLAMNACYLRVFST